MLPSALATRYGRKCVSKKSRTEAPAGSCSASAQLSRQTDCVLSRVQLRRKASNAAPGSSSIQPDTSAQLTASRIFAFGGSGLTAGHTGHTGQVSKAGQACTAPGAAGG